MLINGIPFNRPAVVGNEYAYIADAINNGHISGDGAFTYKCQQFLERELGVGRALLTTSCTHALEMCALLLDLGPNDEVIVPSFTFVSTANAFALRGARLVFCDIRPDTLNIDENRVADLITPRTKAVVVVHYAGVGCEMDALADITVPRAIPIIEDNAHGLFGQYRGRNLGTIGPLATLSFHETKNFSCGEGGALLINDPIYNERADVIRQKGTDRNRFYRGEVDKYTWVDIGSSYPPSDALAAFLYAQFEAKNRILAQRRHIWETYYSALAGWASDNHVILPTIPEHSRQPWHIFYLIMPNIEARQALIDYLKSQRILSVFHYQPLHLSAMGRGYGGKEGDCPVTEDISERIVRLPFYFDLSDSDQAKVVDAVREFRVR